MNLSRYGVERISFKRDFFIWLRKPSYIQSRAIVPFIQGNDVIAQAQSGTGKTATFTISCLQRIDEKLNESQVIVLTHTCSRTKSRTSSPKFLSIWVLM